MDEIYNRNLKKKSFFPWRTYINVYSDWHTKTDMQELFLNKQTRISSISKSNIKESLIFWNRKLRRLMRSLKWKKQPKESSLMLLARISWKPYPIFLWRLWISTRCPCVMDNGHKHQLTDSWTKLIMSSNKSWLRSESIGKVWSKTLKILMGTRKGNILALHDFLYLKALSVSHIQHYFYITFYLWV